MCIRDSISVTGDGLGNCLYSQVGAFSDDPPPDPVLVWVSLQDVSPVQAAPGLDDVPGVGQAATWSGTELSVWTGELGIIVLFPGGTPPGDPLDAATKTATLFM